MITFTCPTCGIERTGKRRRCYPCTATPPQKWAREKGNEARRGAGHTPEAIVRLKAGQARAKANGWVAFDIGAATKGKPSPHRKATGTTRLVKGGTRVQVKCDDGKWRYRARVVWAEHHGPIAPGVVIHHRNESPMDDRIENLEAMTRAEHARHHHV